ncbi:MAG: GNAT family N-acetyltransferase [Myxococcota bacterium]
MSAAQPHRVALARPEHFAAMREVERAAEEGFSVDDLPLALRGETLTSDAEFSEARAQDLLWCALDEGGEVLGWAIALRLGRDLHLDEIDVHPRQQRRGVGSALVQAVWARAEADGVARLTLTTFRFVSWNQPWYERLGFVAFAEAAIPPALRRIYEEEIARGLARERRVAMALELAR